MADPSIIATPEKSINIAESIETRLLIFDDDNEIAINDNPIAKRYVYSSLLEYS